MARREHSAAQREVIIGARRCAMETRVTPLTTAHTAFLGNGGVTLVWSQRVIHRHII